jgi:hypothetical protein
MSPEKYSFNEDNRLDILVNELNEIYKNEENKYVVIKNRDLSNLDLSGQSKLSTVFENCNLGGTKFDFASIYIRDCQAGIDIRGTRIFISAIESNFAHMQYDRFTKVGNNTAGGNNSIFTRCVTTREFREFAKKQGAMFTDKDSLYGSIPIFKQ